MAEKKKETKKTDVKKVSAKIKKTAQTKPPVKAQANTQAKTSVKKEEVYPAINIANTFGIPNFAFYMMKEAKKFNDGTLMTISQFQKYYKEIVEGR